MSNSHSIHSDFDKLSILVDINQALSRNEDLTECLRAALTILERSYQISWGAVYLTDEYRHLTQWVSIGSSPLFSQESYQTGEDIPGRIAQSGLPVVIPNMQKEPELKSRLADMKKDQSLVGTPISLDEETLGVLLVQIPFSSRRDFHQARMFLSLVASALLQPIRIRRVIELERQKLQDENVVLRQRLGDEYRFHNIIGNSHQMQDVYAQITQVAPIDTTILLRGESGTGKELIAEAVHYNSTRKDGPFIRVNCAAIPETLIESEFFGYEKGAFTGATARKKGRFEVAHGGTLFLDEVGDLSQATQVKLLRVLQERSFERVGGTETIRVDVRIIAATNVNLEEAITGGGFREDLYYRLNVFSIFIPPLRERKTDILLLADHFMIKYGRRHSKPVKRISTPAIDMLMRYHWPGNVRELENCIERAVVVCEEQVIHGYHLPPTLQTAESSDTLPSLSLKKAVMSYEKELIQDALKTTRGNRARTARLLGSTERIIGYKIQQYGIDAKRFKPAKRE